MDNLYCVTQAPAGQTCMLCHKLPGNYVWMNHPGSAHAGFHQACLLSLLAKTDLLFITHKCRHCQSQVRLSDALTKNYQITKWSTVVTTLAVSAVGIDLATRLGVLLGGNHDLVRMGATFGIVDEMLSLSENGPTTAFKSIVSTGPVTLALYVFGKGNMFSNFFQVLNSRILKASQIRNIFTNMGIMNGETIVTRFVGRGIGAGIRSLADRVEVTRYVPTSRHAINAGFGLTSRILGVAFFALAIFSIFTYFTQRTVSELATAHLD